VHARAVLERLIAHAAGTPPPFVVEADRAVGVHAWRSGEELAIWLVNFSGVAEFGAVSRAGPVRIALPGEGSATAVRGESLVRRDDGSTIIELPHLDEWECVRVSP
jgi:hypothetical protein